MTTVTRGKQYEMDEVRPWKSIATGLAAVGAAHGELGRRAAMAAALTDRFSESFRASGAEPYLYPIPFACSKACGGPIRTGDLFVQTSPDWKPLERAHVACVAGRKGLEGDTPDDAVREVADALLDELGAVRP